jgi:hypothetical protein
MTYAEQNQAKADFDSAYVSETPHLYIAQMARFGYQIGEQARPYCAAAADLLREQNGEAWPVQMLDIGCSYGIGSAFVKYGCSFDEIVAFFSSRAPTGFRAACDAMRMWLNVTPPVCDVRCVGLDSSKPAIRYAVEAGLLDGGIARNFEDDGAKPSTKEARWFRSCNLMICTGAIGYVTERTLGEVLHHLGKDYPAEFGPFAVVTVLRMFDETPIANCFDRNGLRFQRVPGTRLPQRRFTDGEERQRVLSLLHDRGIDTSAWEDQGRHYADLFIATPPEQHAILLDRMMRIRDDIEEQSAEPAYLRR